MILARLYPDVPPAQEHAPHPPFAGQRRYFLDTGDTLFVGRDRCPGAIPGEHIQFQKGAEGVRACQGQAILF